MCHSHSLCQNGEIYNLTFATHGRSGVNRLHLRFTFSDIRVIRRPLNKSIWLIDWLTNWSNVLVFLHFTLWRNCNGNTLNSAAKPEVQVRYLKTRSSTNIRTYSRKDKDTQIRDYFKENTELHIHGERSNPRHQRGVEFDRDAEGVDRVGNGGILLPSRLEGLGSVV